jgi:dTDP-4-dehydrorhamnose 3,5-epimerase
MKRLDVRVTPLAGVMSVRRRRIEDARGFLARLFCEEELSAAGWSGSIAQLNLTRTHQAGTVRGMHYQLPPHAEVKLVTCLRGEVWDVAVDLRAGSPTFLRWHAEPLSESNDTALLLPEGVAHGFQALTPDVELLYCHSRPFMADAERGVDALDARLGISWPLPVRAMSERDRRHPPLDIRFVGVQP